MVVAQVVPLTGRSLGDQLGAAVLGPDDLAVAALERLLFPVGDGAQSARDHAQTHEVTLNGIGPALTVWVTPSPIHWPWIIAMGIFGSLATVSLTRSFAAADASVVMPFNFLKLPFAVMLGLVMFAEMPDLWTNVGAAIIFSTTYYMFRREARDKAS